MKKKSAPLKRIYRVSTGSEDTSPANTQEWLVQATSMVEALSKAVAKIRGLEHAKVTIDHLGVLVIR